METPRRTLQNKHFSNVFRQSTKTALEIPPSPLMKSLGHGTGVNVYRLNRFPRSENDQSSASPWAIKKIAKFAVGSAKKNYENRLKNEAEILRKLTHPNVIGYRGFNNENGFLALECCDTALSLILEDRLEKDLGPLESNLTLKFCKDILAALDYIHTEASLLHGDLKSHNILVKNNFEICKLCDFGVSLPLDKNGYFDRDKNSEMDYIGTELWSAPEVLTESGLISSKSDIFSFGLVVYETIALVPPHTLETSSILAENLEGSEELSADPSEYFQELAGTRPPLPNAFSLSDGYNKVVEIFYICTSEDPDDRPSAKGLLIALSEKEN